MSMMRIPWTIGGQWVSGTAVVAVFAAGCGTLTLPGGAGDLVGTIVNSNKSTDLIGGVHLKSGEGVYGFGTWLSDGSVGDLTSIVYQDRNGGSSTLYLDSGRPSRLVGANGSRLEILYQEVSAQRLAGTMTFTPAGGQAQAYTFDIDLLKTAQDVAALVQQLTGLQISSTAPPDGGAGTTGKSVEGAAMTSAGQKPGPAHLVIAAPVILVVTGFTLNLILSQLLNVILLTADVLAKAVTIAVLTPFILMGNLMRLALGEPLITLAYNGADLTSGPLVLIVPRPQTY